MSSSLRSETDSDLNDDGGMPYADKLGGCCFAPFGVVVRDGCGIVLGCWEGLLFAWVALFCSHMEFVASYNEFDESRYIISGALTENSVVLSIGDDSDCGGNILA